MRPRIAAAFAVLALLIPGAARAASCFLFVGENQRLDWGTLQKPSAGSQNKDITVNDVVTGTGTQLYGVPVHGQYTIRSLGGACTTVTITVTVTGGATGVTLSNLHLDYNGSTIVNGQSGLADPTLGGKILKIGATATFTNAVSIGTENPGFNISVSSP